MAKAIYIALLILALLLLLVSSCEHKRKAKPIDTKASSELLSSSKKSENNLPLLEYPKNKNVDTRYEYVDDKGDFIVLENSYPKGGLTYTDPKGNRFIYAVFWTSIENNTTDSLKLSIDFLEEYRLPSSPGRVFQLLIPKDTLAIDKDVAFNHGLDLKKCLDNTFYEKNSIKKRIEPNAKDGFYVVTLFSKGVEGTLRTALRFEEDKILYRVNDMVINCGSINLNKLKEDKTVQY